MRNNKNVQSKSELCVISGAPGEGKTTTGVKMLIDSSGINSPPHFKQDSRIHLFANTYLRGVKFMYLPLEKLIEYIKVTTNNLPIDHPDAVPLIGNGVYLYDEGSQGANARESTSSDTMVIQNLVTQSRKRKLKIIFITQDVRLLTWEIRKLANEWIECERRNKNSSIITLTVKKDGKPVHSFNYDGSRTWPYFHSNQLHALSDARLAKAYARARTS
jgi:hypothetical protein